MDPDTTPQSVQASKPPAISSSSGLSGRLPFFDPAQPPMPLFPLTSGRVAPQADRTCSSSSDCAGTPAFPLSQMLALAEHLMPPRHAYCKDAREEAFG